MSNFIDEQLRTLAQLRLSRDAHRQKRDVLMDGLNQSKAWIDNEKLMAEAEGAIFDIEVSIKEEAINYYLTSGEKVAHAGTKIKIFRKIEIDHAFGKAYCLENLPEALTVQNKTLEKVLKALPQLPSWATEYEEPRAQISTDLGKVFEALDETEMKALEDLGAEIRNTTTLAELETAEKIDQGAVAPDTEDVKMGRECVRCMKFKNTGQFFTSSKICDECRVDENDDIPF